MEKINLEKILYKLDNLSSSFDYFKITIASPARIKSWAERRLPNGLQIGEIKNGRLLNFHTNKPEPNGLFCEKIFGPINDWRCACGKYNGMLFNTVCENCFVEITDSRVRRFRMGYIELSYPIAHPWYSKGFPNYLCLFFHCFDPKITTTILNDIIYFRKRKIKSFPKHPLYKFLYPKQNSKFSAFFTNTFIKRNRVARKGNEILKAALESLCLIDEIKRVRNRANLFSIREAKQARVLESFLAAKMKPSSLFLTVLPVLPPVLRPFLKLNNGTPFGDELNDHYRLILLRDKKLRELFSLKNAVINNMTRKLLQESIDALILGSSTKMHGRFHTNDRDLKSLTEILQGKEGQFRMFLLGKRVDYSGRAVITAGPMLRFNECGLPYKLAVELFEPLLLNSLLKIKGQNIKTDPNFLYSLIQAKLPLIWFLLGSIAKDYLVLLNRAPTLHRFGVQAFSPLIVLGHSLRVHPYTCGGFNADFDGDQMAVHLPLYESSQLEARILMKPCVNVLSPANGKVLFEPAQDIVMGCYYLTCYAPRVHLPPLKIFSNEEDALCAFNQKKIRLQVPILVRYNFADFQIRYKKKNFYFGDDFHGLVLFPKKLKILKSFYITSKKNKKIFVLTTLGLLIIHKLNDNKVYCNDFFIKTTVGRLIFDSNLRNVFNSYV